MQEIEKEQQRLLQQMALESQYKLDIGEHDNPNGNSVESVSYQPTETGIVPTTSSSEVTQDLETQYAENNSSLSEVLLPSSSSITIQNESIETNKRIDRLEKEVQWLSKPFTTNAYLQAADQDIPLLAQIDPVKKVITSIEVDKSY
jgi:hypothetical protein